MDNRPLMQSIYYLADRIKDLTNTISKFMEGQVVMEQLTGCNCHEEKGEHYHCVDCNKILTGEDEGNRCFDCWEKARNDIEGE